MKPVSLGYQKGTGAEVGYFFARNGQGDIVAVYRSSDSKLIGTYEYDLWGRPISTTEATAGIDTDGILSKNPLRYRGYYFDEETGFYYLQSRYYDAGVRRFISADSLIADVGSSVQGHNLFAYCFNNPIDMSDDTGCWPKWIRKAANWVNDNVIQPIVNFVEDIVEDCKNFDIHNKSEQKVLESHYFSIYKGVPVFRINGDRSGSFGVLFITRETNERENPEDIVRHEYGHFKQLQELGLINYALCIGLPSWKQWGTGEYYSKPWEITADIYGGVQSRVHSQDDIDAGVTYLAISQALGPFAWITIE